MFDAMNQWILVFLPILGIGLAITIAVALLDKVGKSLIGVFRDIPSDKAWLQHQRYLEFERLRKLDNPSDEEKPKRQYVETDNWEEGEKPKRHSEPAYILGDDGELLEIIDDKPKRGLRDDG